MDFLIKKEEALRYLGYKNQEMDIMTDRLIDDSIIEIQELARERAVYREFELIKSAKGIHIRDSELYLRGKSIEKHLKDSDRAILIAFSLGHEVDRRIRYYEKNHLSKALILDSVASAAIEAYADYFCLNLEEDYRKRDKKLTRRFSPGYGDLDIGIQGAFLNILNAGREIGLTATENSILIPRKSVTAIIGIIDKDINYGVEGCQECSQYETCIYSKGDEISGD